MLIKFDFDMESAIPAVETTNPEKGITITFNPDYADISSCLRILNNIMEANYDEFSKYFDGIYKLDSPYRFKEDSWFNVFYSKDRKFLFLFDLGKNLYKSKTVKVHIVEKIIEKKELITAIKIKKLQDLFADVFYLEFTEENPFYKRNKAGR